MNDMGHRVPEENMRGTGRSWLTGRTLLVGVLGALVVLAVGVISAAALVGLPTLLTSDSSPTSNSSPTGNSSNAGALQATPTVEDFAAGTLEGATLSVAAVTLIDHVCPNKTSGKLFYLATCKKSQTLVPVISTSTQFKACYVKATRVTRKVSNSTRCRDTENTIPKVPADTTSLYFCVDSDGVMYFKGSSEPTCGTRKFAVEIGPHNLPPTAAGDGPYSVEEDASLNVAALEGVLANDSDPGGDPITAQLDTGPSHADSFTLNADGSFSYKPEANYNGSDSFTYKAKDSNNGLSASVTVTITVTSVNDEPVANDDGSATSPAATTDEDTTTGKIDVLSNDTGLGDTPITVSIDTQGSKGTATVNSDNTVTYNPNADANGSDSFVYKVTDTDGQTDTATVHVVITALTDTPAANDDGSTSTPAATVSEDSTTGATVSVLSNDTGLGDTPITVSIDTQGSKGTATVNSDNTVTYVPGADESGSDSFVYEVCDGDSTPECDTATVSIAIDPVNDAPGFDLGADQSVANTAGAQTVAGFATNISAGPSDESGQTLTFDVTNDDNSLFSVQPDIDEATGDLTYTPDSSASGTATVTVTLMDDGGTANGGQDTSATKTFKITVKLPNSPPTATSQSVSADEDVAKTITLAADDPDGDAVTSFSISEGPAHGSLGSVGSITCNDQTPNHCTADVSYTAEADYNGPDQFKFTASDAQATSDPATVDITVNAVDDPPVAVDDTATVNEDSEANAIDVLTNDTDADGGTKTIDSVTQPANGAVVITGGGTGLTYQPKADYCNDPPASNLDTFDYTLNGGETATVSVTVTCVEDDPVAVDDTATKTEDSGATAIDVLTNDTDVDGGTKTIDSVTQPANGTVVITGSGSGLTYEPDADYCNDPPGTSSDTFDYTLNGGDTATVSVKVTCVDDPPVAVNDSATVLEDATAASVSVLTNDTDIDGGPKTISSVTQPANGTVVITGGGTGLTYAPKADYCNDPPGTSPDTFTYKLNGGSEGTVSMKVTCVNDAPIAVADSFTSTASSALANTTMTVGTTVSEPRTSSSGNPLSNDTDVDSPASGFTATPVTNATTTRGGKVTINSDGTFTYRPPPGITTNGGSSPDDTFTYTLHDNGTPDQTATGTVSVRIVGPTPWYVDDSASAGGNGTSGAPFQSLGPLSSGGGSDSLDGTGDRIFVYSGTYASGIALEDNQKLLGEPQGLSFTDNNGRSQSLVAAGGSAPAISSASGPVVGLASGNELQDLSLGNAGSGAATLSGTSVGSATAADSSINNTNGKAVDISGGTLDMAFTGVSSNNSTSDGIRLDNTTGTFSAPSGSLQNATDQDVDISGDRAGSDNVAFTYNGSISDASGTAVSVANQTGGIKSFGGTIGNGSAISLSNNAGATINFSGPLTLTTGSSNAFSATGGGTVNVTGSGNTISTGTGTALNVANTTIGASGLTFRSISANGAPNGIVLNNTGTTAGLTVTGNAGTCTMAIQTCTGGTIQNTTGDGIALDNTKDVSLSFTRVLNTGRQGIFGRNINGFTLKNSLNIGAGDGDEENGILFENDATTSAVNHTGTALNGTFLIQDVVIDSPTQWGLRVHQNAGATNMTFQRLTVQNNRNTFGEFAVSLQVQGSGTSNMLVDDSDFLNVDGGLSGTAGTASGGGVLNLTVQNSTWNQSESLPFGISFATTGTATGRLKATGNTFVGCSGGVGQLPTDRCSLGIDLDAAISSTLDATIQNNTISDTGIGGGIEFIVNENALGRAEIRDNAITLAQPNRIGVNLHARNVPESSGQTGQLHATLEGNAVNNLSETGAVVAGYQLLVGSSSGTGATHPNTVCANVATAHGAGNNTVNGTNSDLAFGWILRMRLLSTFQLQGFAGPANSTSAVAAFVQSNNSGGTFAGEAFVGTGSNHSVNYTSATCQTPTTPTLP